MKTETLKKLVELAEGFEISEYVHKATVEYREWWQWAENVETWEHFPLLIHRAIQGFNRINKRIEINLYNDSVDYDNQIEETGSIYIFKDHQPTDTLTVEEVCLLKALEEVFWMKALTLETRRELLTTIIKQQSEELRETEK